MRIVAALGGNALLQRGERPDADVQQGHIAEAAQALAPLARQHELVLTHGNGPQVGLLALQSASDPALREPYPLDVLGAQTQGMIGYWLAQAMQQACPERPVACLLSRTLVHAGDPAFAVPAKFVGPVYTRAHAEQLAAERGWQVRQDGSAWRRVVPSPEPIGLVEQDMITTLIGTGVIVICNGGGGVPVTMDTDGRLHGAEAVVDKDLTAALLARLVGADVLLLLTDVDGIIDGYGTAAARPIRQTTPAQLRARQFPAGSMGPKAEAVCRFVAGTGKMAVIGRLDDAEAMAYGKAGTVVVPASRPVTAPGSP
jgi:carbamate kinase